MTDTPLWSPNEQDLKQSPWMAFAVFAGERAGRPLEDAQALHEWSVTDREGFWTALWDFCGVRASQRGDRVMVDADAMPGARYFPDARLNYAGNLVGRRGPGPRHPGRTLRVLHFLRRTPLLWLQGCPILI